MGRCSGAERDKRNEVSHPFWHIFYLFITFQIVHAFVYNLVGATNPDVEHYSGHLCMYLWQLMSKYNTVQFIWHDSISACLKNVSVGQTMGGNG